MRETLQTLLDELEHFGSRNDSTAAERSSRMLNITRETGELLRALIHATGAKSILEIGTSNGYSTLWLAWAAQATGGAVTTVESSGSKVKMAEGNFRRSELARFITIVHDGAQNYLARALKASFDFIFLDAERSEYPQLWPHLKRLLIRRGSLVADNATSHPEEIAPFLELVRSDSDFVSSLLPVGKGEFFAVKAP